MFDPVIWYHEKLMKRIVRVNPLNATNSFTLALIVKCIKFGSHWGFRNSEIDPTPFTLGCIEIAKRNEKIFVHIQMN